MAKSKKRDASQEPHRPPSTNRRGATMKRIKSMFKPAPAAPKATNEPVPRTRRSTRSSTRASSANSRRSAADSAAGATEEGDEAEPIEERTTTTAKTSTEEAAGSTDIATSIEGPPELTGTASSNNEPPGLTQIESISPKTTAKPRSRTPEAIINKPEAPPAAPDQPTSMAGAQGAVPMVEDEDDMYGSTEPTAPAEAPDANGDSAMKEEEAEEEDDDDEEEDESSDDEIQIITKAPPKEITERTTRPDSSVKIERPPGSTDTPSNSTSRHPPPSATPNPSSTTSAPARVGGLASPNTGRPGSSYPEVKTSTLDLEANPTLPVTGKPIFKTDMDTDFEADSAPWRRPGSDQTDYYNYGFDEGTWAAYCIKQRQIRGEFAEDRKRMEQLGQMMNGTGMPYMPGAGMGPAAGAMPDMNNMSMEQMQQFMGMMGAMPGMDGGMAQQQNMGYQNQGGYGGGHRGGRGKRNW